MIFVLGVFAAFAAWKIDWLMRRPLLATVLLTVTAVAALLIRLRWGAVPWNFGLV